MAIDGGQKVQWKHFKYYKINEVDTIKNYGQIVRD